MAGTTGKMTRAAIRVRGPRMRLLTFEENGRRCFTVAREGQLPFSADRIPDFYTLASSYTLGYLLKIGRIMAAGVPSV
jgi:hypothetical protein